MIVDTIVGFSVAPGAVVVPVQFLGGGDNLQVRSFNDPYKAFLVGLWTLKNAVGVVRLRSPQMGNVNGLTFNDVLVGLGFGPAFLNAASQPVRVYPGDVLILEHSGSAVGGEIETVVLMLVYEDLKGGLVARMVNEKYLDAHAQEYLTLTATIAAGVGGGYSAPTALNTFVGFGDMKANYDYALVGYQVQGDSADMNCAAVTILGTDTGNLRYPLIGNATDKYHTGNYTVLLSRSTGMPLIPVFNQANGAIVEVVNSQIANNVTVNLLFARVS